MFLIQEEKATGRIEEKQNRNKDLWKWRVIVVNSRRKQLKELKTKSPGNQVDVFRTELEQRTKIVVKELESDKFTWN